jgi:hypothetical protein
VSERTVLRSAAFNKALERIKEVSPALHEAAVKGHISKKDVAVLAGAPAEVIRSIEAAPKPSWRAAAKQAAGVLVAQEANRPPMVSGRPIIQIEGLAELDKPFGVLVRAKTDLLKACDKAVKDCGGEKAVWAQNHADEIRHHCNEIADAILAWKRSAEEFSQSRTAA